MQDFYQIVLYPKGTTQDSQETFHAVIGREGHLDTRLLVCDGLGSLFRQKLKVASAKAQPIVYYRVEMPSGSCSVALRVHTPPLF